MWNQVFRKTAEYGSSLLVLLLVISSLAHGQSLNWEGQTGVFVTPLAYLVPSKDKGFGHPVASYHYLNAGSILGGFHQASITEGAFNRIEFGYTRDIHQEGSVAALSPLWTGGFNAFHGKANLIKERRTWRPAVSVGFVVRSQVRNVGGVILGRDRTNEDFYAVVTKTVTQLRKVPLVFNAGFKATNASLLGLTGNAPTYKGRVFGAGAFAFKGPGRCTVLLGSEFLQQPRTLEALPGVIVPTTITYAARIIPAGALPLHGWGVESPKLTIDLGVAQAAGNVAPGVNLQARHQFAMGVSYGF
ncbi:MAG: DUF3034 family protein [Acidobacteria bacterium]|nr:DUF3034 family protein [Acidobacteriota bacterium]